MCLNGAFQGLPLNNLFCKKKPAYSFAILLRAPMRAVCECEAIESAIVGARRLEIEAELTRSVTSQNGSLATRTSMVELFIIMNLMIVNLCMKYETFIPYFGRNLWRESVSPISVYFVPVF